MKIGVRNLRLLTPGRIVTRSINFSGCVNSPETIVPDPVHVHLKLNQTHRLLKGIPGFHHGIPLQPDTWTTRHDFLLTRA